MKVRRITLDHLDPTANTLYASHRRAPPINQRASSVFMFASSVIFNAHKYAQVEGHKATSLQSLESDESDMVKAFAAVRLSVCRPLPASVSAALMHPAAAVESDHRIKCPRPNCNARVWSDTALSDHLNRHNGLRPYKCGKCARRFPTRQGLSVHSSRKARCASKVGNASSGQSSPSGKQIFPPWVGSLDLADGKQRTRKAKVPAKLECLVSRCGKTYWSKQYMKQHQVNAHGVRSSGMIQNGKTVPSFSEVDEPCTVPGDTVGADAVTVNPRCSFCVRRFPTARGLAIHESIMHRGSERAESIYALPPASPGVPESQLSIDRSRSKGTYREFYDKLFGRDGTRSTAASTATSTSGMMTASIPGSNANK
jgi:hypothetical protein